MKAQLCTTCGTIGPTKRLMKGSFVMELFLWMLFLIPGLIYSLWRLTTAHQGCRKCGGSNVIPLDSPVAQKFLAEQSPR